MACISYYNEKTPDPLTGREREIDRLTRYLCTMITMCQRLPAVVVPEEFNEDYKEIHLWYARHLAEDKERLRKRAGEIKKSLSAAEIEILKQLL